MNPIHALRVLTLILFVPGLLAGSSALSQTADSGFRIRPAQVTLIYPIGSNGTNTNFTNYFSLNLVAGVNGAVNGVELGGFLNSVKREVLGFQAAGFMNFAGTSVKGVQAAGFANFAGNDSWAGQLGGFMNINDGSIRGLQAGGFMNINGGYQQGLQAAGFMNINGGWAEGLQAAGFANIAGDSVNGLQTAGFANFSANHLNGAQIAGFMNIHNGSTEGLHLAGFGNITSRDVTGAQISGLINVARYVKGLQLGFINVCDSIDGVPLGLISVVSDGYRKLEIWAAEAFYFNIGFKMGVRHLYTVYTAGMQPYRGGLRYGLGLGLGSEIPLNDKSYLNIDALTIHVNEDIHWTRDLNLLNQLRFIFGSKVQEHTSLYVGPTLNIMVSHYVNPGSGRTGSGLAPWTLYNRTINGTNVQIWPGVNLGLKF